MTLTIKIIIFCFTISLIPSGSCLVVHSNNTRGPSADDGRLRSVPSASNNCYEQSKLVTRMKVTKKTKESSWEECRDGCDLLTECEYFNYDSTKKNCVLYKIKHISNGNFVSGKKNCRIEEGYTTATTSTTTTTTSSTAPSSPSPPLPPQRAITVTTELSGGVLLSPNYPQDYPPNQNKPSPITSSGKKMTVTFHSDRRDSGKGFRATWRAVIYKGDTITTTTTNTTAATHDLFGDSCRKYKKGEECTDRGCVWYKPRRRGFCFPPISDGSFESVCQVPEEVARRLDPYGDLTHDEFLDTFGLPPINNSEEKERRNKTLKENQEKVLEHNIAWLARSEAWIAATNEFSDIPDEEFISKNTGLLDDSLLDSKPDEESERFFNAYRYSRQDVPTYYSSLSKDKDYVSPVRKQGGCGSCVAFSTMALVETCFKKIVGKFGDYSEQHLLDCADSSDGTNRCEGTSAFHYIEWLKSSRPKLASEADYPYQAKVGTCRGDHKEFNQGAEVSGVYIDPNGNEETLKKLVFNHGAVLTTVKFSGNFREYTRGIFDSCKEGDKVHPHAVVIVGYGTENDVDYWLVRNSWGKWWGDQGYIKIKRGVHMCGIGRHQVVVECQAATAKGACLGLFSDWDCCTENFPCYEGEGNCNKDSDCAAGLKCGHNNCRNFRDTAEPLANCCFQPDPVHGEWGEWTAWTSCDKPCGGGEQSRERQCDSPAPRYGGNSCPREAKQSLSCNTTPCLPGLFISGGYNRDGVHVSDVELFIPSTSSSPGSGGSFVHSHCRLPSLPKPTAYHTQDGLVQCGGWQEYGDIYMPCHKFVDGTWILSHNLTEKRRQHISWQRDGEIYLMGGWNGASLKTTEIVSDSSAVSRPGFSLKYRTSDACSITDTNNSVVIIGGVDGEGTVLSRVSRYNTRGFRKDLPSLINARYSFACALYTTDTGAKVYFVMGGRGTGGSGDVLSSTEQYTTGDASWTLSTALPHPMYGVRAVTLDRNIFLTGMREIIWRLNLEHEESWRRWTEVGWMKTVRYYHGMSVINHYCPEE